MGESFRQYCQRKGFFFLLDQWQEEANLPLTPDTVTYGSKRRIWWRCERGHTWQASPDGRKAGAGCPFCAGVRAWPGETDLATLRPDLAAQWHPTRNGYLTPQDVMPGSRRAVWWQCPRGHAWRATVQSRSNGSGCARCLRLDNTGRQQTVPDASIGRSDLASRCPRVASQWSPRNGELTPRMVTPGSHRKVWWRCPRGHEWQAAVFSRTGKTATGCPACAAARREKARSKNDLVSSA